jgi:hypothetical protein
MRRRRIVQLAAATAMGWLAPSLALASPPTIDAQAQLIEAVASQSAALGHRQDPMTAVIDAELPDVIATSLASALRSLSTCHGISRSMPLAALRTSGTAPVDVMARLRSCSIDLGRRVAELERAAVALPPSRRGRTLDVWPVIRYSPGTTANVYAHDYALVVDFAGDDSYLNNAGGNLLDVTHGPTTRRATGCQDLIDDSLAFRCMPSAAVLIDLAGDDTYGRREQADADRVCTAGSVMRRVGTGGAGIAGVGMLVDRSGDDRYVGKTLSLGMGHAGFGLLRDRQGDDHYSASRNSMGFGLVSGVGSLRDDSGNDVYGWTMPRGGILDNDGACDAGVRGLQGVGVALGHGTLHDAAGNDTYRTPSTTVSCTLVPSAVNAPPAECLTTGNQGFGSAGGLGVLRDDHGRDRYAGMAGRADETTIRAGAVATGQFGLFVDAGG